MSLFGRKHWTVKLVDEGLFNYCFPPDFRLQLREQLTRARQGTKDARNSYRDTEMLGVRFLDVTEIQLRQIFWDGIRTDLRWHLIENLRDWAQTIVLLRNWSNMHSGARRHIGYGSGKKAKDMTVVKDPWIRSRFEPQPVNVALMTWMLGRASPSARNESRVQRALGLRSQGVRAQRRMLDVEGQKVSGNLATGYSSEARRVLLQMRS
jgi:hypothetical protein